MEFPIEEVKSIFNIAKSTVDVIRSLCSLYPQFEPDDDEAGKHGEIKDWAHVKSMCYAFHEINNHAG